MKHYLRETYPFGKNGPMFSIWCADELRPVERFWMDEGSQVFFRLYRANGDGQLNMEQTSPTEPMVTLTTTDYEHEESLATRSYVQRTIFVLLQRSSGIK